MIKKSIAIFLVFLCLFVLVSCDKEEEKPELLFYIGITMVKPVSELVENFEKENNCTIKILQGGSQDLYDSLLQSELGDLYMPGSYSYRNNNLEDGFLLDAVLVGYNKASLMVRKGNPKGFSNDLSQLEDENNKVVICNSESGSIGRETKKILDNFGNYEEVFNNAVYLTTDSRNLTGAIINGDADLCINWHATSMWEENSDKVEVIDIDQEFAKKKMLILNLTSCAKHPELTKKFMEYAASEEGKKIFLKYGFLEEEDLETIDGVEFE